MKKAIALLAFVAFACGPEDPGFRFNYTVINNSGLALVVSCTGCEMATLAIGETKTFGSNNYFFEYDVEATTTTTRRLEHNEGPDYTYTITSFEWEVEYRITGTVASVDVTLANETGGVSQYTNVTLPKAYRYQYFTSNAVYISAQNNTDAGAVSVEIWHKDKLFKTSYSSGAYVIATASGSID